MHQGRQNQPHSKNPYASAAGAYGTNAQKNAGDPRETEALVLLKSAQQMQDLQAKWDAMDSDLLHDTLKYNRNIWMMFYDTATENPDNARPQDLRNNIYNLAKFIFKREIEILSKPEKKKLDILISINRDIAAGLMEGVRSSAKNDSGPASDIKNPPSGGTDHSA